jgi:competence protein ComEA
MKKLNNRSKCAILMALLGSIFMCSILTGCGTSGLLVETVGDDETTEVYGADGDEPAESESGTSAIPASSTTSTTSSTSATIEATSEMVFGEISDASATDSTNMVTVYVCGAVVNEGVYELPEGSRVSDALKLAGGYDDNSLHGYVNLAKKVEDGERIYFPDYQELEELGLVPMTGDGSSSGGDSSSGQEGASSNISSNSKVNINTADAETLKTLPGIGDTKAADIIAYREQHGAFTSITDIQCVSGIGESTYNRISSLITVD